MNGFGFLEIDSLLSDLLPQLAPAPLILSVILPSAESVSRRTADAPTKLSEPESEPDPNLKSHNQEPEPEQEIPKSQRGTGTGISKNQDRIVE